MRIIPDDLLKTAAALLNMTEQNGCTPNEAAIACEKLMRLAEKHGVTLEDLRNDMGETGDIGIIPARIILKGPVGRAGAFLFAMAIADGFECKMMKSSTPGIRFCKVFFCGFKADAMCAAYLFETILPKLVKHARDNGFSSSLTSFLYGAGLSISMRLITARKDARRDPASAVSTAVILHDRKQMLIQDFLERKNIRCRTRIGPVIRSDVMKVGQIVGESLELNKGLAERAS